MAEVNYDRNLLRSMAAASYQGEGDDSRDVTAAVLQRRDERPGRPGQVATALNRVADRLAELTFATQENH